MDWAAIARIAKVLALVCFVLPWLTLSCAGQPLATASGFDLVLGQLTYHDPSTRALQHRTGAPDIALIVAAATIATGLVLSFVARGRAALGAMLATSAIAFCLCFLGEQTAKQPPNDTNGQPLKADAAQMFRFDQRYGFYTTLAALGTATGACLLGLGSARRGPPE
jgi:hypothetical protein